MAKKLNEDTDHKNLTKRGSVWYIKRLVDGERIVQSTQQTDLREARRVRDRVLNSTYLRDEKDREEAVLAKVESLDRQLAKIENDMPSLVITDAWTAYRNAPNRPDSGARTMDMYESQFKRFAAWMQNNYPKVKELRGVTEEIAYEFAGELGRTLTPNSYNKYLVLYRRVWKVLYKVGRLTVNPWTGLDNKLLDTHSRRELTIEELTKVCESVQGEMRGLFAVGIYCGLRLGDAVQLKWGNVDLIRKFVMVIPSKTARRAHGKVLKIPLHHSLLAMLAETPEAERSGYVFPDLAALYQHDDTILVKRIKKVFEECEIETMSKVEGRKKMATEVGFHSLRHSFVSLSANAGANLAAVQAVIGHSSPAMTRHYLHADQNNVKNAVALLPNVTGITTEQDEKEAENARMKAAVAALEGLTAGQLKMLIEKAGAELKKLVEKAKKKSGEDNTPGKLIEKGVAGKLDRENNGANSESE